MAFRTELPLSLWAPGRTPERLRSIFLELARLTMRSVHLGRRPYLRRLTTALAKSMHQHIARHLVAGTTVIVVIPSPGCYVAAFGVVVGGALPGVAKGPVTRAYQPAVVRDAVLLASDLVMAAAASSSPPIGDLVSIGRTIRRRPCADPYARRQRRGVPPALVAILSQRLVLEVVGLMSVSGGGFAFWITFAISTSRLVDVQSRTRWYRSAAPRSAGGFARRG